VPDISYMFHNAYAFDKDISSWDVSSVANLGNMFYWAKVFNQDISLWDVSNVKSMPGVFNEADKFHQDLSSWDVSGVVSMVYMFYAAMAFNGDISSWDLSSVPAMTAMFYGTYALNKDLSSWDISSVTTTSQMFKYADHFKQVLCWNMSEVTNTAGMFQGCAISYANAIDNPVCFPSLPPTSSPTPLPLPTRAPTLQPTSSPTSPPSPKIYAPSSLPTAPPIPQPESSPTLEPTQSSSSVPSALPAPAPTSPVKSASPTFLPSPNPSRAPSIPSLLPSDSPTSYPTLPPFMSPTNLPSFSPTSYPTLRPSISPTPLPSTLPTPAPSVTPWFLTRFYFELSAAAGLVGIVVAVLFAGLFRLRLGRWPPLLRTVAAVVSVASLGIEVLYSAAAASSSGQFCTDCPSEAGWAILMLSGITCGTILMYRLHQLRVALDTSVALGSVSIYALVTLLACLEGDLLVWLPWMETPATLALAGFPDDSSISFTTWSILLRKVPFLSFTASNAARSDAISATEYLTLIMTGFSLAVSLSTKFLRQIAFSNTGLDVFVGVRNDASRIASYASSRRNQGISRGDARLGDMGDMNEAFLEDITGDNEEDGKSSTRNVSSGTSGYVGIDSSNVSSTGWLQTVGSAAMGIGIIVLVVTDKVPSLAIIVEVGKYLFFGICAILGVGIITLGAHYAYAMTIEGCCNRETIRKSVFETLKDNLESAEKKERDLHEAAAVAQRRQEYLTNFVQSEFGVDPEQLLPLEEVKARLQLIMPRVEAGTANAEDETEMNRLMSLLDANPEAKQRDEEAREAFRAEQASANATAARHLRTFFPPEARLLPSVSALETAGVGTSVAKRLLRNNALTLALTPPEEIASMHWVDLSKCSSLGLSLFELRAVVASLPVKFATDTAKGEKREWAKGLVEALRSMAEKDAKGELNSKDLCHPCFSTDNGDGGSSQMGPFDPDLPLTRRPTAVRSEPMSGAAEAQAAAALITGPSIKERTAAIAALGKKEKCSIDRPSAANSASARRLRGRLTSSTEANTESRGNGFLAAIAGAAAARREVQKGRAATVTEPS